MSKEHRDITKFTPFLRPAILAIWKNYDKAVLKPQDFEKKYPNG